MVELTSRLPTAREAMEMRSSSWALISDRRSETRAMRRVDDVLVRSKSSHDDPDSLNERLNAGMPPSPGVGATLVVVVGGGPAVVVVPVLWQSTGMAHAATTTATAITILRVMRMMMRDVFFVVVGMVGCVLSKRMQSLCACASVCVCVCVCECASVCVCV